MVLLGGGVRHVSSAASVAGRLSLPCLRRRKGLDDGEEGAPLRGLSTADVADRRYDSRGYAEAVADLVSGNVVRDQPEERWKCAGPATHPGLGQLSDGLGLAA